MLFTVHSPNQHSQMVFQQYHTPFSKYRHTANDASAESGEITLYNMRTKLLHSLSNYKLSVDAILSQILEWRLWDLPYGTCSERSGKLFLGGEGRRGWAYMTATSI